MINGKYEHVEFEEDKKSKLKSTLYKIKNATS